MVKPMAKVQFKGMHVLLLGAGNVYYGLAIAKFSTFTILGNNVSASTVCFAEGCTLFISIEFKSPVLSHY